MVNGTRCRVVHNYGLVRYERVGFQGAHPRVVSGPVMVLVDIFCLSQDLVELLLPRRLGLGSA